MSNFRIETVRYGTIGNEGNIKIIRVPTDYKTITLAIQHVEAVRRNNESFVIQVSPGEYKEDINVFPSICIQGLGIFPEQVKIFGKLKLHVNDIKKTEEVSISNLCIISKKDCISLTNGRLYAEKIVLSSEETCIDLLESHLTLTSCEIQNTLSAYPTIHTKKSELSMYTCNVDNKSEESPSLILSSMESTVIADRSDLYGSIKSHGKSLIEIRYSRIIVDTTNDDTDVIITSLKDKIQLFFCIISGDTENIKVGEGDSIRFNVVSLAKAYKFSGGNNIKLQSV